MIIVLDKCYHSMILLQELKKNYYNIIRKYEYINCKCCYNMFILMIISDREEVKQVDLVQVLQDHYTNVLMHSLQQNHGTSSTQLWVKIMRILPTLDDISRAQDEIIGNFQVDAVPGISPVGN